MIIINILLFPQSDILSASFHSFTSLEIRFLER